MFFSFYVITTVAIYLTYQEAFFIQPVIKKASQRSRRRQTCARPEAQTAPARSASQRPSLEMKAKRNRMFLDRVQGRRRRQLVGKAGTFRHFSIYEGWLSTPAMAWRFASHRHFSSSVFAGRSFGYPSRQPCLSLPTPSVSKCCHVVPGG